eukprot:TRINITY_DN5275_c0_g1_i5.p1 TRINITY_DN5275_c0_g1~~TRINITY_DN5275_c0_g1_i5.p1  ORF type:complete len:117 (+),score=22.57 TRINITY_DN5275_c0_g1_i5:200-550(+)
MKGEEIVLPEGWREEIVIRQTGATTGRQDHYWFSPSGLKFRSKVQIRHYLETHENGGSSGDEKETEKVTKKRGRPTKEKEAEKSDKKPKSEKKPIKSKSKEKESAEKTRKSPRTRK